MLPLVLLLDILTAPTSAAAFSAALRYPRLLALLPMLGTNLICSEFIRKRGRQLIEKETKYGRGGFFSRCVMHSGKLINRSWYCVNIYNLAPAAQWTIDWSYGN